MLHPKIILDNAEKDNMIKNLQEENEDLKRKNKDLNRINENLNKDNASLLNWKRAVQEDTEKFKLTEYCSQNGYEVISSKMFNDLRIRGIL